MKLSVIAEGSGIDHAHPNLVPLNGTAPGAWRPIRSSMGIRSDHHERDVSSHDGRRRRDAELDAIAARIRAAHTG